ncbi:SH3 domain-containing protein [Listeria fleischmannii]|uniref:SH3 domain-containing protein n=1 Tax=Listeria fleischmannii TaxID=1069827 RepID=A0A841YFN9_9LIST|nr:SH3 domain-containing protein [Listeria fleischmannii]EIA19137.1 hypothetical protein KKC_14020 [Listeria fleischmannii subsp. coloradonensis]MBC1399076.1 hypothetical protein [Listeria fleischmannii]MBC1419419.1 hypothetical protein [Listeria fleischmannii]MBC1427329.1 hypothetical protein [Listeria fleischmannii]STY34575.1 Variant SH3 domain [Listeria fleischmannii subsp. coloradonensis]
MNQVYVVNEEHRATEKNPLFANKNEEVLVNHESKQFPNWYFCKVRSSGKEGYIPKKILSKTGNGDIATVLEDFSARELNVKKGDKVESNREIDGFAWCVSEDGVAGWLPTEKLNK